MSDDTEPIDHRQVGAALFNGVWELLEKADRTRDEDDRMTHMVHASCHHWRQVGTPAHFARGEWQCSRVYATLGRPEPALHHAQRTFELCTEHGLADWDLAFAHEALARAHAVAGHADLADEQIARARAVPIAEDDDREALLNDLASIRPTGSG